MSGRPDPIIPPDALLNIPHLGRLRLLVPDPETVVVETVERNQNPKFSGCDHTVTINNVEYGNIRVRVHSSTWWLEKDGRHGGTLVWTTDGNWAALAEDVSATRVDPANRGRNISESAVNKLVKRVMLFLDGYMPTQDAQRMIHECDIAIRQSQITHSRGEIKRLNNLLDAEKKKLSEAMRVGMSDLIDLRRALQDGGDLEDILYPTD
jgi:hypothetical protein